MPDIVFCLMGPTASGKTALAASLLKHFLFEIISVDSAMIYKDMDIGTAKPSKEELEVAPHHLIDIINPDEVYSAAQFCSEALTLCDAIKTRGKIPLLVGGTMMYFNAIQKGLSELPESDSSLREQLENQALTVGWDVMHQRLKDIDPIAARRIHAHDTQRIQRALEVFYLTGMSLTDLLAKQKPNPSGGLRFVNIALFPQERAWLHDRIAQRFDDMLHMGFVEEVILLQKKWNLNLNMPSMRCVGYRQVLEYLNGDYDESQMREKAIAATRQLAKRQLTWLRSWDNALYYDPQKSTFSKEIIAKTREILDNMSS